jgi:hypothetical protein
MDKEPNQKGARFTRPGTMDKNMLQRHKLKINTFTDLNRADKPYDFKGGRTAVKKTIQMFNTYRLLAHGVIETKLARSLVETAQWFATVNKPEYKQRDAAPADGTEAEAAA